MGGHLLYSTNISKSQGYARTLVQPVQNFGERIKIERSYKVLFEKAKEEFKNKNDITLHSLSTILGQGMTQGTYNVGNCLFACATAALSVDILSVDAQPYRLALGTNVGSADFVVSMNSKESNKFKNKKIKAHCPSPSIDER